MTDKDDATLAAEEGPLITEPMTDEEWTAALRRGVGARQPHVHEYALLYWHYGEYGPQNVHLHPCGGKCSFELVGPGRTCSGAYADHVPYDLRLNTRKTSTGIPPELAVRMAEREAALAFYEAAH